MLWFDDFLEPKSELELRLFSFGIGSPCAWGRYVAGPVDFCLFS